MIGVRICQGGVEWDNVRKHRKGKEAEQRYEEAGERKGKRKGREEGKRKRERAKGKVETFQTFLLTLPSQGISHALLFLLLLFSFQILSSSR